MDGLSVLVILSITVVLVGTFNTTCIYVIMKSKKLIRKPSTILILSLLTMHLLQAFLVMPFYALKRNMTSHGAIICVGFRMFYFLTFYLTVFNVLLISLDRFLALRLKTHYAVTVTNERVFFVLACVWLYVIMLTMIPFDNPKSKCLYNPQKEWVIFMLLGNGALPFVIITLLYVDIVYTLRYYSRKLDSTRQRYATTTTIDTSYMQSVIPTEQHLEDNGSAIPANSNKNDNNNNNKRATRLRRAARANNKITRNTMIVIATYALAWTPSIVYFTLKTLAPSAFHPSFEDSPEEAYVDFFLKYIKFVEGLASPVLYCYLNGYFKSVLRQMCCTPGITLDRMTSVSNNSSLVRKPAKITKM